MNNPYIKDETTDKKITHEDFIKAIRTSDFVTCMDYVAQEKTAQSVRLEKVSKLLELYRRTYQPSTLHPLNEEIQALEEELK